MATFASRVWTKVREDKELNIPVEREFVALHRSTCVVEGLVPKAKSTIEMIAEDVSAGGQVDEELVGRARDALDASLTSFDNQLRRFVEYSPHTVEKQRNFLASCISKELLHLFQLCLKRLSNSSEEEFLITIEGMKDECSREKGSYTLIPDFLARISAAETDCLAPIMFCDYVFKWESKGAEDADEIQTQRDMRMSETQQRLRTVCGRSKEELQQYQFRVVLDSMMWKLEHELEGPLRKNVLDSPDKDMWKVVANVLEKVTSHVENTVRKCSEAIDVSEHEVEKAVDRLSKTGESVVLRVLHREADTILVKMKDRFTDSFKRDERGLPRRWRPGIDVAMIYNRSVSAAMSLIQLFCVARIGPYRQVPALECDEAGTISLPGGDLFGGIDEEYVLITPERVRDVTDAFREHAEAVYQEALTVCILFQRCLILMVPQAIDEWKQRNSIPRWALFAMLLLGWNEIIFLFSNPVAVLLLLIASLIIGVAYFTHHPLLRPLFPLVDAVVNVGQTIVANK